MHAASLRSFESSKYNFKFQEVSKKIPKTAINAPATDLNDTCSLWRNMENGIMNMGTSENMVEATPLDK